MKDLIRISLLSIIASFLSFACQKVIDLDAERLEPQYAVDGSIDVGSNPLIVLTKTTSLYGEFSISSIEESFVNDAIISVSDGVEEVILEEYCDHFFDAEALFQENRDSIESVLPSGTSLEEFEDFFLSLQAEQQDSLILEFVKLPQLCFYTVPFGTNFLGEAGKTYTLNITKDGDVISSTTTIPSSFLVDSLSFRYNENHSEYAQVFINITFPSNSTLGRYVKFGSRKQNENWNYNFLGGSVYSDATFDGATNLVLPLEARQVDEGRPLGTDRLFQKGDTAYLQWRNIDRESYDFLFSIENDGGATPFTSPTKIESNIVGGLGFWGGFNTTVYSVYIP